jgi:hypothetical protein
MVRFAVSAVIALFAAGPALAGPRDDLLRVTPADAAVVVVVQNARDHHRALANSPFGRWFPSTEIGKKILGSPGVAQFRETAGVILRELGTTPGELVDDVLGDAAAFAFSPGPPGRPKDERAVILVRPRRPETLRRVLDRVKEIQSKSGELASVERKEHAGSEYFERRKTAGPSEFYCFRGDVFAFSSSEVDIKAVIDRDRVAPPAAEKAPELLGRLERLGVADAAAVVLINPRPLDAEVKARVEAAKPEEKRFLARFAEAWAALDAAAVYLRLDTDLEIGVSLRFEPTRLPADLAAWLTGTGAASSLVIPNDALVGVAGHARASDVVDLVASVAPVDAGKPGVKEFLGQTLGAVVGRDNVPAVLSALGPDWAAWLEPPATGAFLPTAVAAVAIGGEGPARERAEKALTEGISSGFQFLKFAYNLNHADHQIELKVEKDAATGVVITSLVNEKGFPPGFRPSFAVLKNHLVLATSPDAVRRFDPQRAGPRGAGGDRTLARLNGTAVREYLKTHGAAVANFLAGAGVAADEKQTREKIETLTEALELLDSAELVRRPRQDGLQLVLKVKTAKPLKK